MNRIDATTPVVVFTTSVDPLLHSPLGVARSLGRLGVPVHVAQPGRRSPTAASRYVTRTFTLVPRGKDDGALVEQLVDVADAVGGRPVLVPVDDEAALLLDDFEDRLAEHYRFPRRPLGLAARLADKRALDQLCEQSGVPRPRSSFPADRDDLRASASRFPVVVKAVDPLLLRRSPGARSVTIADDEEQLLAAYELLAAAGTGNVMVQEYVPGGPQTIWMFNGYFDASSRCRFGATGVKLRQCLPGTGPTSLGETRASAQVRRDAERLLGALGYTGIVDLGFRYDARDGAYKLLDVNPRIGGTFRLFTARSGLDVVRALYLDLTGQPVPEGPDHAVPDGRRWQDEPHDLLAQGIYRARGEATWPQWLASMRGVDERAWCAADDLVPFALMCRHAAMRSRRGLTLIGAGAGALRRDRGPAVDALIAQGTAAARW